MRTNNAYRCERDCYMTDDDRHIRCPRCGGKMLQDGEATEENVLRMKQEAADRQIAYLDKFASGSKWGGA